MAGFFSTLACLNEVEFQAAGPALDWVISTSKACSACAIKVPDRLRDLPQTSARTPAAMPWAEPLPCTRAPRQL